MASDFRAGRSSRVAAWVEISTPERLPLEVDIALADRAWQLLEVGIEIAIREVSVGGEPAEDIVVHVRRVSGACEIQAPASCRGPSLAASERDLEEDEMQVEARPDRFKDRDLAVVEEWVSGCIVCGDEEVVAALPGSEGMLTLPLCPRHVRWALASRREGMGKQSRRLRGLLFAWCRLHGDDRELAKAWLAKGVRGRRVG